MVIMNKEFNFTITNFEEFKETLEDKETVFIEEYYNEKAECRVTQEIKLQDNYINIATLHIDSGYVESIDLDISLMKEIYEDYIMLTSIQNS